jgi:uncharacterized protein (DUF427 family)
VTTVFDAGPPGSRFLWDDPSVSAQPAPRIEPGPGQESVWDYPRPPLMEPTPKRLRVIVGGVTVADSTRALKVMETASPPTYYVPRDDVRMDLITPSDGRTTFCEWKGTANYFDIRVGEHESARAAWTYEDPRPAFADLAGHLAFYPGRVDEAYLGEERVRAQAGGFYGGWVTDEIVGPFKGEPGTEGW